MLLGVCNWIIDIAEGEVVVELQTRGVGRVAKVHGRNEVVCVEVARVMIRGVMLYIEYFLSRGGPAAIRSQEKSGWAMLRFRAGSALIILMCIVNRSHGVFQSPSLVLFLKA